MSHQLINRSPDLKRLRDSGYDIEIRAGHLLVKRIPYLNSKSEIEYGILVSVLNLAGDVTATPDNHVTYFIGSHPCHKDGTEIKQIKHSSVEQTLDKDLLVQHSFSNKPPEGYKNYFDKMTRYIEIIVNEARSIDESVTATPFPVIEIAERESVFNYMDTASSRAGIMAVSRKLELGKIAIVGGGGTGSYVLDLTAKTPVGEIHLFDGDRFLTHNAFRAPGAPAIEELRKSPLKVEYLKSIYSRMHRGLVAHSCYINESNVALLREMNFVFLCLDRGENKRAIVEKLEEWGTPFVDVGMGVQLVGDSLIGVLRTTTSTPSMREHVRNKSRIPFADGDDKNDYAQNIQIADLNALNAALAVIKWKKLFGFYHDLEREHYSTYTIDGNTLINEDQR